MFSYLQGLFVRKEPTFAVIDVNGVGYEVRIPLSTYTHIKSLDKGKLYVHLSIKEDAHTLYAFHSENEKAFFLDLLSVSGVGPSTALVMLSSGTAAEIKQYIAKQDVVALQGIKGIGKKTAERIVLELKEKISKQVTIAEYAPITQLDSQVREEAVLALVTLGYTRAVAEKQIGMAIKKHGSELSLEDLILQVLREG